MRTTIEWLDAAKQKHGWKSDYRLAKELGTKPQNISNYRAGLNAMEPYVAAKIAELLEIDPLQVMASAEAERSKDNERRGFWTRLADRFGPTSAPGQSGGALHNRPKDDHSIHYPPVRRARSALESLANQAVGLLRDTLAGPPQRLA